MYIANIRLYIFKALRILFVFSLIVPVVTFLIWYKIGYLPYEYELKTISRQGVENIGELDKNFYKIAVAAKSTNNIRSWAMTQAYWLLKWKQNPGRTLSWHINTLLWYLSSYLNFDEQEVFGIWIECAVEPCNSGLKLTAQKYFNKNLTELNDWQLARLVSFVESPSVYAFGKEKGEKRANEILEKAKLLQSQHPNMSNTNQTQVVYSKH
jgi:hypothetical protein